MYVYKMYIYIYIYKHRSNIRTGDMRSPIASHFRQIGHNVSVLQYIGIEKVI